MPFSNFDADSCVLGPPPTSGSGFNHRDLNFSLTVQQFQGQLRGTIRRDINSIYWSSPCFRRYLNQVPFTFKSAKIYISDAPYSDIIQS